MDASLRTLALALFTSGAIKTKKDSPGGLGFKLKLHDKKPDAPLSPFYANLRNLPPNVVTLIGEAFCDLAKEKTLDYHCVAGIPNAATPFAESMCATLLYRGTPRKLLTLEKIAGQRGIANIVGGDGRRHERVLVLDDVITAAESKREAVRALRSNQLRVRDFLVVIDREQGGALDLSKDGYALHALFTITQLLDLYADEGIFDYETLDEIRRYLFPDA